MIIKRIRNYLSDLTYTLEKSKLVRKIFINPFPEKREEYFKLYAIKENRQGNIKLIEYAELTCKNRKFFLKYKEGVTECDDKIDAISYFKEIVQREHKGVKIKVCHEAKRQGLQSKD